MKVTFLGQAGLLFEANGVSAVLDPYLSDSVKRINPAGYRRVPVLERFLALKPDFVLCTHDHLDHYDEETLDHYLSGTGGVTVLVPPSCYTKVTHYGKAHNCLCMVPGNEWTEKGFRFLAVPAFHSEPHAIGYWVEADGLRCYVTGDTLYNEAMLRALPGTPDVLFLPTNGQGNNMGMADAVRFASRVGARHTVPLHRGMLDDMDYTGFDVPGTVIPEIYKEIKL